MIQPLSRQHHSIERERVRARLESVFEVRAGEVTGPPGSGKTTALKTWASSTTVGDVAWLLADSSHRDSVVLARAVADALRHVAIPDDGAQSADAAGFVDDIADAVDRSGRRVVVVIDNAETLDDAPSLGVIRRLTSLECDSLRVVVAGRTIPDVGFEEFRRRGELVAITANDLRLDASETAEIVRTVSQLQVGEETLATIHEQIDGWALGAVLAALALQTSRAPLVAAAKGIDSHRYFEQYFETEVFATLPEGVRAFLLDTCVLDLLEPALCTELTGNREAERILRHLERNSVFTEWLGGRPPVYRYHSVLRSWLRAHLDQGQPSRAAELVRLAASWCESQGRLAEAIEYRLAAGDSAGVVALMTVYGPRALGEGRYEAIRTWISALPNHVVTSSFTLLILLAEAEHRLGNPAGATAAWALTRGLPTPRPDAGLDDHHHELTIVVQRGTEFGRRGRILSALAQARRAVEMIDFGAPPVAADAVQFQDVVLAINVASIADQFKQAGHWDECVRLSKWVVESFPADNPSVAQARVRCLGQWAVAEVIQGSRFVAEELAQQAIALCRFFDLDPLELGYSEMALLVAGPKADRPAHHASLEQRVRQVDLPWVTCLAGLMRAWSYVQTGDTAAARRQLAVAEHALNLLPEPGVLTSLTQRVSTIVEAGTDEPLLRPRELQVLSCLAAGGSRREVSDQLHLSVNTVKTYARLAYRALDVSTLDDAVARCALLGIPLDPPDQERTTTTSSK